MKVTFTWGKTSIVTSFQIERQLQLPRMDSPSSQTDITPSQEVADEAAAKEKRKASRKKRLPTTARQEDDEEDSTKLKKAKKRKVSIF